MQTSRIDRCEPRYAGTKFTNRGFDIGNFINKFVWDTLKRMLFFHCTGTIDVLQHIYHLGLHIVDI